MSRSKTVTVYTFDELSPEAKERVREWWRSCRDSSDFECVRDDVVRMGEILGISFQTHEITTMGGSKRREPNVWWQVGYMQSDGAGFDGTYGYAKGAHTKIRAEAPQDETLHGFADTLLGLQRRYRYGIVATIRNRDFWPEIELLERSDISADDYKALQEVFRGFYRWMYKQFRTEDEYQSADEQVDENIRANDYEFTEEGEIDG